MADCSTAAPVRRRRTALVSAAFVALLAAGVVVAPHGAAQTSGVAGGAYVVAGSVDVDVAQLIAVSAGIPAQPSVHLPPDGAPQADEILDLDLGLVGGIEVATATTSGSEVGTDAASATSRATLEDLRLLEVLAGGVQVTSLDASCTSGPQGSTASTLLVGASVFGTPIEQSPDPNTVIQVPVDLGVIGTVQATVVLNEQTFDESASHTAVEVNALRVIVDASLPLASVDIDVTIGNAWCAAGLVDGIGPPGGPGAPPATPVTGAPRFTG